MPPATPFPSIVWPPRSIVIPSAATTSPSQMQSPRSLLTLMLTVIFWPQKTVLLTGAAMTRHECEAGLASRLPDGSTARTRKVWGAAARSFTCLGDVHAVKGALSSEHSKVAEGSPLANLKIAPVSTVYGSGPGSSVVPGGSSSVGGTSTSHWWEAGL